MLATEDPLSVRTHGREAEKESKPEGPRSTILLPEPFPKGGYQ